MTDDIITLNYFIAQFYNYSQDGGMTTITFGLDGFTEDGLFIRSIAP